MRTPILAVALLLPMATVAQETPSYSYADFGYLIGEVETSGADEGVRGLGIELSTEFSGHVHGYLKYYQVDDDEPDLDAEGEAWSVGVGAHFAPVDGVSVYGRLGYLDASGEVGFDLFTFAGSDDGYYVEGGVRGRLTERLELRGGIEYFDLDVSGDDEWVTFGGDYMLTDVVALSFDFNHHDDAQAFVVGARFYPGNDRQARRR